MVNFAFFVDSFHIFWNTFVVCSYDFYDSAPSNMITPSVAITDNLGTRVFFTAHLHLLSLERSCVTQAACQFYMYFPRLEPS